LLKTNETISRPKTSRELFSPQNFKSDVYVKKAKKPPSLIGDIDLGPYSPLLQNKVEMQGFKMPDGGGRKASISSKRKSQSVTTKSANSFKECKELIEELRSHENNEDEL